MDFQVSVLMATHAGDMAIHLGQALESVFNQTRAPDELVLVLDGPIGTAAEQLVASYRNDPRIPRVKIRRLPVNCGLANALNAGLGDCHGQWIMRMDSDDIALPDRLRLQLDYASEHPEADLISSWCEEFSDDTPATRIKSSPVTHDAIVQALKWRNVLVHPTILVRAGTLWRFGGYRTVFDKLEDYDLFVRLALGGVRFRVIPKALLKVRVGRGMMVRRGGFRYCWNEVRFRAFCWTSGLLTAPQFAATTLAYLTFRLIGATLRGRLYGLARVGNRAQDA
jgi:glycosyltransferase involved in cell wall biosynthesis